VLICAHSRGAHRCLYVLIVEVLICAHMCSYVCSYVLICAHVCAHSGDTRSSYVPISAHL